MDRYIGLDAHAQSCTLAVMGPSGKRISSMVVETNGRALINALKSIPGRLHLCIEEGNLSAWLHETLSPHVAELVVMVAPKTNGAKDDLRDAFARADDIRTGRLVGVFKAPKQFAGVRAAARAYGMALRDTVRIKNRLKAIWLSRGITTSASIYETDSRAAWLKKLPSAQRQFAELHGRMLDELAPLRDEAEAWLLKEAKSHPITRTLATAPGLGPVRTAQLVAIVVSPHRFRTSRQFWSYCGLAIVTRSSSDWEKDRTGNWVRAERPRTLGLSRRRQPQLKAIFKGAATTVIGRMKDHPLHQHYQRMLDAGIKPNLAKLTIARQIAAATLSMWKHEEVYDLERQRSSSQTT
jgi:transposase